MIFQERKNEQGYNYICQDVFGEVEINSPEKLDGDTLDSMISLLLKGKSTAKTVTGSVETPSGLVEYKFVKTDTWSDDKEICENTHTSTIKQVKGFTQILQSLRRAIRWLPRFVVAFRQAWKNENVDVERNQ